LYLYIFKNGKIITVIVQRCKIIFPFVPRENILNETYVNNRGTETLRKEKKKKTIRALRFYSLTHSDNPIIFRRKWRKNKMRNELTQQRPEMKWFPGS